MVLAKLAIIGAGPSGLTLARILQVRNFAAEIKIFEHDSSVDSRDQGGTLDMHQDGGQVALKAGQLYDEFMSKFARPEGQETRITDSQGKEYYYQDENSVQTISHVNDNAKQDNAVETIPVQEEFSRPEVDRLVLRRMLLQSLKPGTVQWNKHLEKVEQTESSSFKLFFKDGTSELADFVVGADGCWSKVRPLISPLKPQYTGVTFVESRLENTAETVPYIDQLVGKGTAMSIEKNKGIIAQRNGENYSIRVYIAQRCDIEVAEEWIKLEKEEENVQDKKKQQEVLKNDLLQAFSGWNPKLLDTITHSSNKLIVRPLFAFPVQQEAWKTVAGVTVIGDAAHVMSPFAGAGANMAMLDALELADFLTSYKQEEEQDDKAEEENKQKLEKKQAEFENGMITRTNQAANETLTGLNACLSDEAPQSMVKLMTF